MTALCDFVNKWSFKTSSVLCIEQIQSQILRLPKMSRLKHEFQARYVIMVIMVNCIPRFNIFLKASMFSRIFETKQNVQRILVLNLVKISKDILIFISILSKITLKQSLIQSPFDTFE